MNLGLPVFSALAITSLAAASSSSMSTAQVDEHGASVQEGNAAATSEGEHEHEEAAANGQNGGSIRT